MAVRNNSIAFKKCMIDTQENGEIFVTEIKKDSTETHSLSDWIKSFEDENGERLVDITIKEVVDVEGQGD